MADQPLLLHIRLGPASRAVLSGLMECSITLVSESIVSTVRGGKDLPRRGTFFRSLLRRRIEVLFESFFRSNEDPF